MDQDPSLHTAVLLTPRRAGLVAGQHQTVDVLLRVQAPDAPAQPSASRPPQSLALVIDRSGSMAGQPLAEARRCAAFVLSRLRATDRVALVQFDDRVQRLWPAAPLGEGRAQRMALAGIAAGGATDLHGGWLEGAHALAEARPESGGGLQRVILLSDGAANRGLTDTSAIAAQCQDWAARGISTSTYGLGQRFNEELMVAMARAGGGSSYYGDTAADLMEPFERELALLENLCLRGLRLSVEVPGGVQVQVLNDLLQIDGSWHLPDLAWGAEAWAVLRLTVPAELPQTPGQSVPLLRVHIQGIASDGTAVRLERTGLALPVMDATAHAALAEDELVRRRVTELDAAEMLARVRRAAADGDWAHVDRMLDDAARQFGEHDWLDAVLRAMRGIATNRERERTLKETMYAGSTLRNRLAAKGEGTYSALRDEVEVPAFLRRKTVQGKGDGPAGSEGQ
jgi:Ca-activated chloride channel family protein